MKVILLVIMWPRLLPRKGDIMTPMVSRSRLLAIDTLALDKISRHSICPSYNLACGVLFSVTELKLALHALLIMTILALLSRL